MDQPLKWLPNAGGLPLPAGFIVFRSTPEPDIRAAYEQLKIREKTHFVAVRGPTHAVLNVIGPDALIHTLRRLWSESHSRPVRPPLFRTVPRARSFRVLIGRPGASFNA